jgi:hypothetical protein
VFQVSCSSQCPEIVHAGHGYQHAVAA